MKFAFAFTVLAAATASAAGVAAPPASEAAAAASQGRWSVDYGDRRCSLFRTPDGPEGTSLAIRSDLDTENPELFFTRKDWKGWRGASRVSVALLPSGPATEAEAEWRDIDDGRLLLVGNLGEDYLEQLAASSGITLTRGDRRLDLPLPGAARAVAALRACNEDLSRSWGVDPEAKKALKQPAEPVGGASVEWFRPDDYPITALRQGRTGATIARLHIGVGGRVEQCHVVSTSGSADLDAATCRVITRRVRYMPALNASGEPVPDLDIARINWLLP